MISDILPSELYFLELISFWLRVVDYLNPAKTVPEIHSQAWKMPLTNQTRWNRWKETQSPQIPLFK